MEQVLSQNGQVQLKITILIFTKFIIYSLNFNSLKDFGTLIAFTICKNQYGGLVMLKKKISLFLLVFIFFNSSYGDEIESMDFGESDKYVIVLDYPQVKRQMVAMNVIGNILRYYNYDTSKVDIAVVVFTPPAFGFLLKNYVPPVFEFVDVPKVQEKAQSLSTYGVHFYACKNTMKKLKVSEKDLVDWAEPVPAGVVKVQELQKEGYKPIVIW